MKITIQAKSSGDAPYDVDFLVDGNKLSAHCNCQAGSFGKLCKHKTELLAGDTTRLFDPEDASKLDELQALVARAPDISRLSREIAESEKIVRRKQSMLKKAKAEFESALKGGVELGPS